MSCCDREDSLVTGTMASRAQVSLNPVRPLGCRKFDDFQHHDVCAFTETCFNDVGAFSVGGEPMAGEADLAT